MSGRARGLLGGVGALALVTSLMYTAAPIAAADPDGAGDSAGSTGETTVEFTGTVVAVQTESPHMALLEDGHADHLEEHGHDEAPRIVYTLETEGGMLLEVDESFDELIESLPEPPLTGDGFEGELVMPDQIVEQIEQTEGLADEVGDGSTLEEGTAEADAALEALVEDPDPVTVASGSVAPGVAAAFSGTPTHHNLYVAVINNRGAQPTDVQINTRVAEVAEYWQRESNGALTMSHSPAQTKRYSSDDATTGNRCGLLSGWADVRDEAVSEFPAGTFDGTSNHLLIVAPPSCTGSYTGIGTVGSSFASGGWSINKSAITSDDDGLNLFKHTMAHEIGHNFGFHHAHGIFCNGGSCQDQEYGDIYSVMGYSTDAVGIPALNTVSRIHRGVDDGEAEVVEVEFDSDVTLHPRSSSSGVRAAMVKDTNGDAYYVEYRSGTGVDQDAYRVTNTDSYFSFGGRSVFFASGVTVQQVRPDPCVSGQCGFRTLLRGNHISGSEYRGAFTQGQKFSSPVAGSRVEVEVVSIEGGAAIVDIQVANPLAAGKPTVSGKARVGATLTAKPGKWVTKPSFTYRWLRNGKTIGGATGKTYKLTAADRGKRISVRVSGAKEGFSAASVDSAPTKKVAAGKFKAKKPRISGSKKVGKTLRAKVGKWSPKAKLKYQWLRNGKRIKGATKSKYRLKAADRGKRITVRVTGTKSGYAKVVKISAKTKKIARR